MIYDAIVIGLGAMGSSTLYQLSKNSNNILGIDSFEPPHNQGSSHGETRIIRQAIAEGEEYVPLVLRSYQIWKELEQLTDKNLLYETGILILANEEKNKKNRFLNNTISAARRYGIEHTIYSNPKIKSSFPQLKLKGNEKGYFENSAGFLKPELCIEAQLDLTKANGANIHINESVIEYKDNGKYVSVITNKNTYKAKNIIITAGPWINRFMPEEYSDDIKIYRQVLYWFEVARNEEQYKLGNFPVFNWEFNTAHEDFIYGFPIIDNSKNIKIATEQYSEITTPENIDREVSNREIQSMYETYIEPNLADISSRCVKAEACMYSVAPEWKFLIDRHPQFDNIIIASPCSGHGFKHSAAVGEILADLSQNQKPKIDISNFSFSSLEQRKRTK